jgi:hypothetical protein
MHTVQGKNRVLTEEMFCRSKYDTHKKKERTGLKFKNLILKCAVGRVSAQGQKTGAAAKRRKEGKQQCTKICATETNVFKIECCGSYGQLPTEKETKFYRLLSEI